MIAYSPIDHHGRRNERGVTILLVAVAMVAILAIAALSIDVITLYLAKEEAQHSADQAALAAARVLSVSGITGDPTNRTGNWGAICGPSGVAEQAAQAVATQNTIGNLAATTINVTYSAGSTNAGMTSNTDCQTLAMTTAFGVNPLVTVQLTRAGLPTFFSRIWGKSAIPVSATATAEAFNPSNSGNTGNQTTTGTITPVKPLCVKPWVVPNLNPRRPDGCTSSVDCAPFVEPSSGAIPVPNQGMSLNGGAGSGGVIGETFWLVADCQHINPNKCDLRLLSGNETQPQANFNNGSSFIKVAPANLLYVPGQVGTQPLAVPSCTTGDEFNEAIVGCDQNTNYSCGVPPTQASVPNAVDLRNNPEPSTADAASCLIHQTDTTDWNNSSGQDYLSPNPLGQPAAYPFQIFAGSNNPAVGAGLPSGTAITSSSSIVSLPIYDGTTVSDNTFTQVTFVGFLQVFINAFDPNGNVLVTVLNVAGCGNGSGGLAANPVVGTSPVPIRLITPP